MKKLIAPAIVVVTLVVVSWLMLRSGPHQPAAEAHPQLDALLARCDATGSSLATSYDKIAEGMPAFIAQDRAKALAAARGQIANVVEGRLTVCEQAMAIAQHDHRGSAVMAVGPFVEKLDAAHAALRDLETVLDSGSGDAAARLAALTDAVHAASH
jgi:hypothetical protein